MTLSLVSSVHNSASAQSPGRTWSNWRNYSANEVVPDGVDRSNSSQAQFPPAPPSREDREDFEDDVQDCLDENSRDDRHDCLEDTRSHNRDNLSVPHPGLEPMNPPGQMPRSRHSVW